MYIYKNKILIYKRLFGKTFEKKIFETLLKDIFSKISEKFQYNNYKEYRISYITDEPFNLTFLFVHTITDNLEIIKRAIIRCKEDFLDLFKDILQQKFNASAFERFDPKIYSYQNKFPPNIALVGYKGVGKTTIFNLIRTLQIPSSHNPQIGGDVATLKIGKLHFLLRDFTGQEDIGFLWNNFIKDCELVLIITDSTIENVDKSKFFLKKVEEETPNAHIAVVANKQDTSKALDPLKIEEILGLKTHPMISENLENRNKMINIIVDALQMSEEISSSLHSLFVRNNLIVEFNQAILDNNFDNIDYLFKKISDLCTELGDNPIEMDFYKKYQEIKESLVIVNHSYEKPTLKQIPGDQQKKAPRISVLENLLKTLLINYMENIDGIIAVTICDREGLIITSESRGEAEDESVLGAIAAAVDSYIDRIKSEFSEVSSFFNITTIGNKKFSYCSTGLHSILLTISDLTSSDTQLRVFSEHIAGKIELLLEGNENVSLEIPEIIKVLSRTRDGKIPTGNFSLKLILTGDFKVGKTSLIKRFVQNLFYESYHATIGVDISKKEVELSEETVINFAIWDIGGQIQRMAPYRKRFYQGANSAFIVIDRTRLGNLESVDTWYNEIKKHVGRDLNIILVGNKSDLKKYIVISEEEIRKIAEENGFLYILTSAKTGENVNDAFLYMAYKFLESVS